MPNQFDFYHGGGLDMAFLGMGEVDRHGNINVSNLGKRIPGSGGFIDISQNAKTVVFCGTFTNGDIKTEAVNGKLRIVKEGIVKKFVDKVNQITFSGEYAAGKGQNVIYVTERAVFRLENGKLLLTEIAPGVNLAEDILAHMGFVPEIAGDLKTMDAAIFKPGKMRLSNEALFSRFK